MPRVLCNICKKVLPNFDEGAKHMAGHEPTRAKPSSGQTLFKVGWKKDGTIRQPRGEK